MSLQGKTALVTGSAGGLGLVIATHLLSLGANIIICDINASRLAPLHSTLSVSHPDRTLILEVDVADESSVQNLINKSIDKFGALDIVVNNAGIMDRFDPAGDCDKATWDRVLAVNLTGPFLVTKYAVPHMQAQAKTRDGKAGGLIINIGSVSSFKGVIAGAAYTASKHGIMGLSKNTAGFYGRHGVYSVALLLGGMEGTNVHDAMAAGLNTEGMGLLNEMHPGCTFVPLEHVARYVAFLIEGDMAKSVNGSSIVLNSNWPMV